MISLKTVLVLKVDANPWIARMWLRGLTRYAHAAHWRLELAEAPSTQAKLRRAQSLIRSLKPDGIVSAWSWKVCRGELGAAPTVWLDTHPDDLPRGASYVLHERSGIARLAAAELKGLGLSHFAAVGLPRNMTWSSERVELFGKAIAGPRRTFHRLETSLALVPEKRVAFRRELERWLKSLPRPCGIFCVCDRIAVDVLAMAHHAGFDVPADFAVVGVDDDEDLCLSSTPTLTSVATDWEKGGFLCGQALDELMRNPSSPPPQYSFGELGVVRRESTSLRSSRIDSRVSEASAYIRQHACEGIGVEDVVRQMGCSRRLAEMRYREAVGRTILEDIRESRLEHVLVLLARRDVPLGVIADRCGWKNPMSLRVFFAQRFQMTLREWRRRHLS